ncbi:bifunctional monothiol glutaredoxin-S16, chloroplastic [Magnolia sinica]|uniref:bifunctional monothiol glutaredoxin-S16, chloroplastic n=1 Tax=Magnolia sinica TaxID=86752 RepID=UPI00265B1895|nr:bifunctional monothiol glutaredoxin-S16, chloroplastic [Magnolia sinica]
MAAINISIMLSHHPNHNTSSSTTRAFFSPLKTLHIPSFSSNSTFSNFSSISCKKPNSRSFRSSIISSSFRKLSETDPVSVPTETTAQEVAAKVPSESGVYAVYDKKDDLQFIGISRNVAASVSAHLKLVPDLCFSVKVGVVSDPDRTALTNAWKSWMEEHISNTGRVPPGNESGNTTWIRRLQKKPDLRLTPGRHVQLTVPLEELIDQLVKENKVVAFIKGSRSAPQCGFSQRVVGILESHGVDFESVNVLDEDYNSGLRETLKKYSNWPTFPQVFVKGELVGGCDILSSMEEKGELAKLFQK